MVNKKSHPRPLVKKSDRGTQTLKDTLVFINQNVLAMNQSKIFAGLVIIVLNISSKFVTIKLSKPMEGYLKYTFSRDVLVFAMAWMGTRDIYTALLITIIFSICANFLFNENSRFCCLPESFIDQHSAAMDSPPDQTQITDQQIKDAVALLANAQQQKDAMTGNKSL